MTAMAADSDDDGLSGALLEGDERPISVPRASWFASSTQEGVYQAAGQNIFNPRRQTDSNPDLPDTEVVAR